jgi:hypothetical protein
MIIKQPFRNFNERKSLYDDFFTDNRNHWEIVNEPDEKSVVTGEGFYIENNTGCKWNPKNPLRK